MTVDQLMKDLNSRKEANPKLGSFEVVIALSESSMGGTPCTPIASTWQGIDWDSSKLFLQPFNSLIRKPNV